MRSYKYLKSFNYCIYKKYDGALFIKGMAHTVEILDKNGWTQVLPFQKKEKQS